jgi:Amidohydrolase
VKRQLQQWKSNGALAIKFQLAYYRSLDFANVKENDANAIYDRYVQNGVPPTAEYKVLQDFLFRYVAREAGRQGLVLHIHTGEGGGPSFATAGSNPLLLESVLNDYTLRGTMFVLVHAGYPFDRVVSSMIKKPNVYTDISGQTFFRSANGLSETLQPWLESFPEKVMFGTDAFDLSPTSRLGRNVVDIVQNGSRSTGVGTHKNDRGGRYYSLARRSNCPYGDARKCCQALWALGALAGLRYLSYEALSRTIPR